MEQGKDGHEEGEEVGEQQQRKETTEIEEKNDKGKNVKCRKVQKKGIGTQEGRWGK